MSASFIPSRDYFAFKARLLRSCGAAWTRLQKDYPYRLLKCQPPAELVNFLMRRVR